MTEIFEFYKRYIELENIIRTGWQLRKIPVERIENDAEHTLQTMILADLIIRKYDLKGIELFKVLEMLLIHEIGEIIIGDLPLIDPNYKSGKKQEESAVQEILNCLPLDMANYYFTLWQEFESKQTKNAQFAFFIDKLDAVMRAKIYEIITSTDGLYNEFNSLEEIRFQDSEFASILEDLKKATRLR